MVDGRVLRTAPCLALLLSSGGLEFVRRFHLRRPPDCSKSPQKIATTGEFFLLLLPLLGDRSRNWANRMFSWAITMGSSAIYRGQSRFLKDSAPPLTGHPQSAHEAILVVRHCVEGASAFCRRLPHGVGRTGGRQRPGPVTKLTTRHRPRFSPALATRLPSRRG